MPKRLKSFAKHSIPFLTSHPLWRGRSRLNPLLRFLRLHVIYTLGEREIWLPWIDNLVLPLQKGDTGLSGNYYVGLHEFRDMAFATHLLRPGDLFVDIGANLGSYSLLASGICGAKSISFEPVPTTHERLKRVIVANDLFNLVDPRCCALSTVENANRSDGLWFSTDRGCCNSFVRPDYPGQKQRVEVSYVDEELSGRDPLLFKIDVEGFERDVLDGGKEALARESCLAVIIEGQSDPVDQCLLSIGFLEIDYFPFSRQVASPTAGIKPNKIWIKKRYISQVSERLRGAPSRLVYGRGF